VADGPKQVQSFGGRFLHRHSDNERNLIRQVLDMEDFAPNIPPDFSERKLDKERMWTQVAAKKV
jgi:hypothetical protein